SDDQSAHRPTDDNPTTGDGSTNDPTDTSTDDDSSDNSDNSPTGDTPDDQPTDDDGTDSAGGCGSDHHRPQSLGDAFAAHDTNNDGVLTAEEVSAEVWERIGIADTDD